METPDQSQISKSDFDYVYEPAEDSYLLIDALELELNNIKLLKPTYCIEIGSGSGIVVTAFGMAFPDCLCFATDINLKACTMTQNMAKYNKVRMESVNMDLASGFTDEKFDIILFNPPYVVTDSEECGHKDITASWAGGVKGREIIDQLLPEIPKKLTPVGVFYMLLIEENIPEEVKMLMGGYGLKSEIILQRRARNEKQMVLKFFR